MAWAIGAWTDPNITDTHQENSERKSISHGVLLIKFVLSPKGYTTSKAKKLTSSFISTMTTNDSENPDSLKAVEEPRPRAVVVDPKAGGGIGQEIWRRNPKALAAIIVLILGVFGLGYYGGATRGGANRLTKRCGKHHPAGLFLSPDEVAGESKVTVVPHNNDDGINIDGTTMAVGTNESIPSFEMFGQEIVADVVGEDGHHRSLTLGDCAGIFYGICRRYSAMMGTSHDYDARVVVEGIPGSGPFAGYSVANGWRENPSTAFQLSHTTRFNAVIQCRFDDYFDEDDLLHSGISIVDTGNTMLPRYWYWFDEDRVDMSFQVELTCTLRQ